MAIVGYKANARRKKRTRRKMWVNERTADAGGMMMWRVEGIVAMRI